MCEFSFLSIVVLCTIILQVKSYGCIKQLSWVIMMYVECIIFVIDKKDAVLLHCSAGQSRRKEETLISVY
jgi:hypothetical protein